jgi:hypothetical protein
LEDIVARSRTSIRLDTPLRRTETYIDVTASTSLRCDRWGGFVDDAPEDRVGAQGGEVRQWLGELLVRVVVCSFLDSGGVVQSSG